MLLTRRGLVACALLLPKLARAQGKPEDWRVLEARKSSLRLVPESAAETEVPEKPVNPAKTFFLSSSGSRRFALRTTRPFISSADA